MPLWPPIFSSSHLLCIFLILPIHLAQLHFNITAFLHITTLRIYDEKLCCISTSFQRRWDHEHKIGFGFFDGRSCTKAFFKEIYEVHDHF